MFLRKLPEAGIAKTSPAAKTAVFPRHDEFVARWKILSSESKHLYTSFEVFQKVPTRADCRSLQISLVAQRIRYKQYLWARIYFVFVLLVNTGNRCGAATCLYQHPGSLSPTGWLALCQANWLFGELYAEVPARKIGGRGPASCLVSAQSF